MIHIAALNDDSGDESESEPAVETTKEALEAEAYALYNKALELQRGNLHQEAEIHYKRLLNTSLLKKAVVDEDINPDQILVQPGFMLKYSTYKNLASLASQKNDKKTAMEFYLEAVNIDSTDVSLWYKIGHLALELVHIPLARIAFEQAFQCNPKHWPSLDNLCTVLFALCDYPSCLYYIAKCFELDSCYPKGHVLCKKIFSEQPALERDTFALFEQCGVSVFSEDIIEDESQKFLEEAFDLRKKGETEKPKPSLVKFQSPLKKFTWQCLGECLISLYNYIDDIESLSFSSKLDLADCLSKKDDNDTAVSQQNVGNEEELKEVAKEKEDRDGVPSSSDDPVSDMPVEPAPDTMTSSTAFTQQESQSVAMETDHDYASSINIEKNKRGPKRKRGPGDEPAPGKRRSARVRNTTTKKKEEVINYQTLLRGFLPSSLRNIDDIDESSQDSCMNDENRASITECLTEQSSDTQQERMDWRASEEAEVRGLLEMCVDNNNGVIDLMTRYLISLSKCYKFNWPSSLVSVFISCYDKLRKHLRLPSIFCNDSSHQSLSNFGNLVLAYIELKLDQCIEKISNLPSSVTPENSFNNFLFESGGDCSSEFYHQDLLFTKQISTVPDLHDGNSLHYEIRVYWVKARFSVLSGNMEQALENFDLCSELLSPQEDDKSSSEAMTIKLTNCKHDSKISLEEINKKKKSLERTQSLEEVRRLFDSHEYSKVTSILLPTLKQPLMVSKGINEQKMGERPSQILLLLQSLLKQDEYQKCLSCSEIALIEAIHEINHTQEMTSKEEWIDGLIQICIAIERTIAAEKLILKKLESGRLVRLTNNLIRIIEIAMETDVGEVGQVSTVYPWILLYRLIKHEEDQIESMKISVTMDSPPAINRPCLPSSLMLLLTAHEYLGRRSWCCNDKGALLKLHISVLEEELFIQHTDDTHPFKSDLEHALEQSFYCLYGHPNRKAKARHLSDHGVDELPLVWEDTRFLFNYFKPKILPEFDSYKTSTMSSELETLLLKISRIIPAQENPANTIESVQAYLDGTTDTVPSIPPDKPVTLHVVQELYYLLADYYFKNKEWGKAIKFYLHDLCVKPDRFDSWAGMAMARSTRLELKINSCDTKSEGPIFKLASSAARCFERALDIDSSNSTLWMEYGSLSYMVHSYSSRQLKQEQNVVSEDTKEFLRMKKNEMLKQAKKCYEKASKCEGDGEEEEWLVHYMLGKIAEKEQALPQVYLDHYKLAAMSLHENEARYPKKIPYHNPPDLALESLEVFFRIHASILKLLEFPDKSSVIDYKLLKRYIDEARQLPFARGLEKRAEGREYSTSDTDTEPKGFNPKAHYHRSSPIRHGTVQQLIDHDYFETRKKISRTASQESTDTASDLDFFSSGDEPMSPRFSDSNSFQGGIKSPLLLGSSKKNVSVKPEVSVLESDALKTIPTIVSTGKASDVKNVSESTLNEAVVCSREPAVEDTSIVSATNVPASEVDSKMSTTDNPTVEVSHSMKYDMSNRTGEIDSMRCAANVAAEKVDHMECATSDPTEKIGNMECTTTVLAGKMGNKEYATTVLAEKVDSMEFTTSDRTEEDDNMECATRDPTDKGDITECTTSDPAEEIDNTELAIRGPAGKVDSMECATSDPAEKVYNMECATSDPVEKVDNMECATSDPVEEVTSIKDNPRDPDVADIAEVEATSRAPIIDSHNVAYGSSDPPGGNVQCATSGVIPAVTRELRVVLNPIKLPASTVTTVVLSKESNQILCNSTGLSDKLSKCVSNDRTVASEDIPSSSVTDVTECIRSDEDVIVAVNTETSSPVIELVEKDVNPISTDQGNTDVLPYLDCPVQNFSDDKDKPNSSALADRTEVQFTEYEDLNKRAPVSTIPQNVKQKQPLVQTHKHISSFQMAFLMSPLICSKESTVEKPASQPETENVPGSLESTVEKPASQPETDNVPGSLESTVEKPASQLKTENVPGSLESVENPSEIENIDKTSNQFPNIRLSECVENKPDSEDVPVKQFITVASHDLEVAKQEMRSTSHQLQEAISESVEPVSRTCVKPSAVSEVLRKLQLDYPSSGESQSEEEIHLVRKNIKDAAWKEEQSVKDKKEHIPHTEEIIQTKEDNCEDKNDEMQIKSKEAGGNENTNDGNTNRKDIVEGSMDKVDLKENDKQEVTIEKEVKEIDKFINASCEVMDTDEKEEIKKKKLHIENTETSTIKSEKIKMVVTENEECKESNEETKKLNKGSENKSDSCKIGGKDQRSSEEHVQLIDECILGLKLCLSRFSQHYKALYRMAHVYHYVPTHKNDQWSRDILLGTSTPWNQIAHLAAPALFADANKTKNFFHGIWRIPVEEIDRSGSFPSHMYKAIYLLIGVLLQLKDHQMLLQLAVKLNRTPELNKKYLRDQDRQFLSTQSYEKCLAVLTDMIEQNKSSGQQEQQRVAMMFVYRANQVRQNKLQIAPSKTNNLLVEAFKVCKKNKIDKEPGVLEQALRYCASIESSKLSHVTESSLQKSSKDSPKPDTTPTTKISELIAAKSTDPAATSTTKVSDPTATSISKISYSISASSSTKSIESSSTSMSTTKVGYTKPNSSDVISQSRDSYLSTFADQFKHFASSFTTSKFQQETVTNKPIKRALNMGHVTKEVKRPLLQLRDDDLGTALLDKRSHDSQVAKDTSISLKSLAERTQKLMKASSQVQAVNYSLASSAHDSMHRFPLLNTPSSSTMKTSSNLTTSPPKDSIGSGLTIPFHRLALGGGQHIKAASVSSSRQSDPKKTSHSSSGIHARVLPIMSDEEKEKLKSSLSQIE